VLRAQVEPRVDADVVQAKEKLQNLNAAGSQSWPSLTAALGEELPKPTATVAAGHAAGCQFLRELPETLIDDLATKCGRAAHDHCTISASSKQHTSDY
jgi:hypothetical protein